MWREKLVSYSLFGKGLLLFLSPCSHNWLKLLKTRPLFQILYCLQQSNMEKPNENGNL